MSLSHRLDAAARQSDIGKVTLRILLTLALAAAGFAQSEADLKHRFEGKMVRVKLDMPGTHQGIDLHPGADPVMDFGRYSSRIKQYGIAIDRGQSVMVTLVRVHKKNIEFQLAGGGFGTFGDSSSLPSSPSTYVGKSEREKRLEQDLKSAPSSEQRRIREALDAERRDRRREEDYRRRESDRVKVERAQLELEKRRTSGSRFNLWFPEGRLQEAVPTAGQVESMLAEYVEFEEARPRQEAAPSNPPPPTGGSIRRGMSRDEVHRMLGRPVAIREWTQADLPTVAERFESPDSLTEVTYVNDVVVKFAVTSK